MSSLSKKIPTVVLFTPGLGCDGEFFDETIEKLKKNSNKVKEFVYSTSNGFTENVLNMRDFDTKSNFFRGINKGYYSKSMALQNEFDKRISSIVSMATTNPDKAILVRLTLQSYPCYVDGSINYNYYDSIVNQKIKLRYIINGIKGKNKNIHIILVGHSQGGLVNLETAIEKHADVYKLISISTPYKSVIVADFFTAIFRIGEAIMAKTGKEIFSTVGNIELDNVNYRDRVKDLANDSYFNNLHSRWNALGAWPKTLVITGTTGHIITRIPGLINTKQAFDGLVRTSEQKDLSHATIMNLSVQLNNCPLYKSAIDDTCISPAIGYDYYPCGIQCPLPYISIEDCLSDTLIDAVIKAVKNRDINSLKNAFTEEEFQIGRAIIAAISDTNDYAPAFKKYYDIYHSQYSHYYLPQCNEVIGRLISELTTY